MVFLLHIYELYDELWFTVPKLMEVA